MISTLIVDDDFRVADIHAAYVGRVDGFAACGTARTAAQATREIAEKEPDLVLLDLYLPDEHGLTLMRATLAEHARHPDFVVITAARDAQNVRAAMQLGAVHYLVKPFNFARLEERLSAYRRLREQLAALPEARQQDVDALYGLFRPATGSHAPPKGQSSVTLNRVLDVLRAEGTDLSATQIADSAGISRPTAHRYLKALIENGVVELDLNYHSGGRPEHRYRVTPSPGG